MRREVMKQSQEYLQISQAEEGRVNPDLTSLYHAAIQSANAEESTSNDPHLAAIATISSPSARKVARQDNNNFASGFLAVFVICAVHSTLVVRWSQMPSEGDNVPPWAYIYMVDWLVSICAYIACVAIIENTSQLDELSSLVGTSLSSLIVLGLMQLILLWVFDSAFPGKQHASLWVLWKLFASWSNVLMAVVMVLRNNGFEWAQRLYGQREEKHASAGKGRKL